MKSDAGSGGAGNSHVWFGYTDNLRVGTYGFGTKSVTESNNNATAEKY